MDRQMCTGAVFIVSKKKASDLVDRECLYKLEHYGVRGSSLDWFQNYLTTQTQSIFWEALVFLSTHLIWCSAGLNSGTTSFCFIHK